MYKKKVYWSHYIIILVFFFIGLIRACNYTESQLAGSWEMTEYKVNGNDEPEDIKIRWVFHKDGRFIQTISYPNEEIEEEAVWNLNHETMVLNINYINKGSVVDWEIVKLEDNIFQVEYQIPGFFVEREFVRL